MANGRMAACNGMESIFHPLSSFPSIWWNWVGQETTLQPRGCQELPWEQANWRYLAFPKQRRNQVNMEPTDLEGKRATWQVGFASWLSQTTHWERSFLEARPPFNPFPKITQSTSSHLLEPSPTAAPGEESVFLGCAAAPRTRAAATMPGTDHGNKSH